LDASGHPSIDAARHALSVPLHGMNWSRLTWLSAFLAESLQDFDNCLLWVTQWGVWPSSENQHLFYRLREAYSERRLLPDAPAHLFLGYERADLTTFIELAPLFGWDFYLLPNTAQARAFVSHDEFLEFRTDDDDIAKTVREVLEKDKGSSS
jgi:hypothetical protein